MEFVAVRHPDIEGVAEVSRPAFDATYREKGWVLVDEEPPAAPADQAPEPPAEQPVEQAVEQPVEPPTPDSLTAEAPTPAPEV